MLGSYSILRSDSVVSDRPDDANNTPLREGTPPEVQVEPRAKWTEEQAEKLMSIVRQYDDDDHVQWEEINEVRKIVAAQWLSSAIC
jgi:hypothetical protein